MDAIRLLKVPIPNNPLENVNAYLIDGDGEYALVDPGWPGEEALEALKGQLVEIGLSIEAISMVVMTHGHPDHFGLAREIRRRSGAEIVMHRNDVPQRDLTLSLFREKMRGWLATHGMSQERLDKVQWPVVSPGNVPWWSPPGRTVEDGEILQVGSQSFEVVWTPGHSPGHICLYHRESKTLLSGDHLLPDITPNVSLNPVYASRGMGNPLGTFIESLDKVAQLDAEMVLPGHGNPFECFKERLDELYTHHEQRLGEVLDGLGAEQKTAYDLALEMPWVGLFGTVRGKDLPLSQHSAAVGETLAHLELLKREGKVRQTQCDGLSLFSV